MDIDDIECPCCEGSGRIAPTGEGLYVFLRASKARVDGLNQAIARATELRAKYLAENPDGDHRVRLCDEAIAAYQRSATFHRVTPHAIKRDDTAAICLQCRGTGAPIFEASFAPQSSDELVAALSRAVA